MKSKMYCSLLAGLFLISFGCQDAETTADTTEDVVESTEPTLEDLKAEIQTLENEWAAAMNARDIDATMAFYADDAVSMGDNEPMASGKEAIRANLEKHIASMPEGNTINYITLEVFGDSDLITEVGTTSVAGPDGANLSTGKYIAVFERQDGKWLCLRDIWNSDMEKK